MACLDPHGSGFWVTLRWSPKFGRPIVAIWGVRRISDFRRWSLAEWRIGDDLRALSLGFESRWSLPLAVRHGVFR
ncbi:hypothetical protein E2C01_075095 [Portunus trituberculatus]|uniref:Uncharacterized protein n=1 Tax=Portunus trituberculatus TaxID=210409 RepID=A0A5B7IE57_PORTR|nr:hypothetical protein [Portunus trituberculatus]